MVKKSKPERYIRWRNDGPKAHDKVEFDDDTVVTDWYCLRIVSVPERFANDCEALGLTRLGYAAD
jgi:hypothetical protein